MEKIETPSVFTKKNKNVPPAPPSVGRLRPPQPPTAKTARRAAYGPPQPPNKNAQARLDRSSGSAYLLKKKPTLRDGFLCAPRIHLPLQKGNQRFQREGSPLRFAHSPLLSKTFKQTGHNGGVTKTSLLIFALVPINPRSDSDRPNCRKLHPATPLRFVSGLTGADSAPGPAGASLPCHSKCQITIFAYCMQDRAPQGCDPSGKRCKAAPSWLNRQLSPVGGFKLIFMIVFRNLFDCFNLRI